MEPRYFSLPWLLYFLLAKNIQTAENAERKIVLAIS